MLRRRRAPPRSARHDRVGGLRVGVDVGGTFTKAVAVEARPVALRAHAVVPTSHRAPEGVVEGVARALRELLGALGAARGAVELVAFLDDDRR